MFRQASQFSTALYPQSLLGNIKRKDGAERDITGQGDGEKGGGGSQPMAWIISTVSTIVMFHLRFHIMIHIYGN